MQTGMFGEAADDKTVRKEKKPDDSFTYKANKIKESRQKALDEIRKFLSVPEENIENQFRDKDPNFWGSEKFIVTWFGNYNGMFSEYKLELCDPFYLVYSGYKCVYGCAGLFHQHQFKGYSTVWRGLVMVGMLLCSNRSEKNEFFERFATPYNKHLQKLRDEEKS